MSDNDTPSNFDPRSMFVHLGIQHAQAHVQLDAGKTISTAIDGEMEREYFRAAERAIEFDYALVEDESEGSGITLAMAAGGFARHSLACRIAKGLMKAQSLSSVDRGKYRALYFHHKSVRVRWMTKMIAIVEIDERLAAAAAGKEGGPSA